MVRTYPKVLCVLSSKVSKASCQLEAINKAVQTHGGEYGIVLPTDLGFYVPEVYNLVAESSLGLEYYTSEESVASKFDYTEDFLITESDASSFGNTYREIKLKEAKELGVEDPKIPEVSLSYLQTCCCSLNNTLNSEYYTKELTKEFDINNLRPYVHVSKKQKKAGLELYKKLMISIGLKPNTNTGFVILDTNNNELFNNVGKFTVFFNKEDLKNVDSYELYGLLALDNCIGLVSDTDLIYVGWALEKTLLINLLEGKNFNWLTPRTMKCMAWQNPVSETLNDLTEIIRNGVNKWLK